MMKEQRTETAARPFSLVLYLLVVFGLSWPFLITNAVWFSSNMIMAYVLNGTGMIMVTVGTYICGRFIFRDGFAGAGWSWGRPLDYAIVLGFAALLWIAPTLIDLAMGTLKISPHFGGVGIAWLILPLFINLIPGFGEEFGWRGYMLPRLARRMSPRRAVIVHALIWWAWHLPITVGAAIPMGIATAESAKLPMGNAVAVAVLASLLVSILPVVLHGVIFAYIWTRFRSLPVSSVYHAAYDGWRDGIGVAIGLGSAALWANLLILLVGIFLLWRGNWSRLAEMRPQAEIVSEEATQEPSAS